MLKTISLWASKHRAALLIVLFLAAGAPFSPTFINIIAGTGLSGGGTVYPGGSTTISMPAVGPGAGTQSNVTGMTLDGQGRVTAVNARTNPSLFYVFVSTSGSMSSNQTRWFSGPNQALLSTDQQLDGPYAYAAAATSLCCFMNATTNNSGLSVSLRAFNSGAWGNATGGGSVLTITGTGNLFKCANNLNIPFAINDLLGIRLDAPTSFSGGSFICRVGLTTQ